jgi:hypothetical protein
MGIDQIISNTRCKNLQIIPFGGKANSGFRPIKSLTLYFYHTSSLKICGKIKIAGFVRAQMSFNPIASLIKNTKCSSHFIPRILADCGLFN